MTDSLFKPLPLIAQAVRDPACDRCSMSADASGKDVCVTAQGTPNVSPKYAVVTKFPLSIKASQELSDHLLDVGLDPREAVFLAAVKCSTWGTPPTRTIIKACAPFLKEELALLPDSVQHVLIMGNEALQSGLGKSGITKYRGQEYPLQVISPATTSARTLMAIPTIAHTAVLRNPGQEASFQADMRFFAARVAGKEGAATVKPPSRIHYVMNKLELRRLKSALENADIVSYDIESTSDHPGWLESDPSSKIVSIAFTIVSKDKKLSVWALPLFHPQSPWRSMWEKILAFIREAFLRAKRSVAHNGKFDNRWLLQWGVDRYLTFDTMLAAHLLNENRAKGLKPLAHTELGVPNWGIDTKELLKVPIMEVLEYNALDTWYTYFLYRKLRRQLLEQPKLRRVFQRFYMPSANEFTPIERRGVWTDRERLMTRYEEAKVKLAEIDAQIASYVPAEHPFKLYDRAGNLKDDGVNFNPSNFLRWLLFEHLGLPVIKRGKTKDDGSPGDPSVAEGVMMELAEHHPIAQLLIDRIEWNKYCSSFFAAYVELIDENDRIHTTFKLHGTTTGRLSSGKENDGEKISAKKQIRGVNLQQVPRNKFIRGLFGAAPGNYFVEFDYSQVELRVAAELAHEPTMIHLYQTGQDIHMTMAMQMTGKPAHLVTKEERKKAKCFHPDTEVLTRSGWKKITDLVDGEEVMQVWPQDNGEMRMEWTVPSEVFTQQNEYDHLYHFKNEGIDIRVTPDHRMLAMTQNKKGPKHRTVLAKDFQGVRGWYNAGEMRQYGTRQVDETLLRLAVATQADGGYPTNDKGAIRFGFVKARKIERLESLLNSAGITYTKRMRDAETSTGSITRFRINASESAQIRELLTEDKMFPWWYLDLTKELQEVVLDEVQYWDSHTRENWKMVRYTSVGKQNIDVLQAMAHMNNRKTAVRKNGLKDPTRHRQTYNLSIKPGHTSRGRHTMVTEKIPYEGEVACLSVESGTVLVRDRGIVCICKQSVNFGFLYGMQWRKYIDTAWNNYGLRVTEQEAQAFRVAFFAQFPELLVWHRRQRALVAKYGRVESPLGRVRHLPDINSRDREVKAEAERQAINSPVQSFASDMILISLVVLHKKFREMGLKTRSIGTVHDAINLEVPEEEMGGVLPLVKHTMENLPLEEWFDLHLHVPIIADCKAGSHWGDAVELTEEQTLNWNPSVLTLSA